MFRLLGLVIHTGDLVFAGLLTNECMKQHADLAQKKTVGLLKPTV